MNSPCAFRRQELPCFCSESMKTIPLTNGKVAIVDNNDFDSLSMYKWRDINGYARTEWMIKYKRFRVKMHQMIIGKASDGFVIDHINRNRLDNRRSNLRFCTQKENTNNRNRNACKGYTKIKKYDRWQVQMSYKGKMRYFGLYGCREDASLAANVIQQLLK